jgi:hypothetical protein
MKNTNKYGFVSGARIFDILDRAALGEINNRYPETTDQQIYTAWCEIDFCKQLCDTKDIRVETDMIQQSMPGFWLIENTLYQGDTTIAFGAFKFVRADKNFCEIKHQQKGCLK